MYKKVITDMFFAKRELEMIELWKNMNLKEKLQCLNEGRKKHFTLFDGPPTANGKPHIGHVLTRAIKDIIPRYKRMKGYSVEFKAGWDTHGLPVELEVEKLLHINGKPQIEAYGIEPFIQQCKQSVWKYQDLWEEMSSRLAYGADMLKPYITYDNNYIESVWWAIKTIADKGLLYKGHKIVPYCPRCGTALASHEVAQGYKEVKENTAYVRFKVKGEEAYFAAWTTTPWTLPSNLALCVHPDETYVLLSVEMEDENQAYRNGNYYLAKTLIESVFGTKAKLNILKEYKGKDLEYKEYEPLFPYALKTIEEQKKKAFFVTVDEYVTMTDGTGIVHIAPAFGEDDNRVGRKYDLPFVQLVKEDGCLPKETEEYAGVFCKEADKGLLKQLKLEGKLIRTQEHEHNYPFCWRCDTPLIYYARHSWYIEMSKLREALLKNNAKVNWIPSNIGEGRFGNFIGNAVDWALSRERYWGTPLPVWICEECKHRHVIGSIAELKQMCDTCPDTIELHRPYIDQLELKCPCCSGVMKRSPEVIDCWFDSGAMPFAQYHYPFENKEKFEANFPSQFISEALDQTRGWFYSLMAISTLLFDKNPYENVIVLGLVQDKNGQKMSKHKGNVVDPWDVLEKQGADAIRWYFYVNSNPWLPNRFSDDAVSEVQRRMMGTLWNTYAFYIMYADIDQFNPLEYNLDYKRLSRMDKWILSRLHSLVKKVDSELEAYDITSAARLIQDFIDDLSNWYLRRGRNRYWVSDMPQDKINAYMTLYTVLEHLSRLLAPFVPFMSEAIYQNLVRTVDPEAPASVHLCSYPSCVEEWILPDLEQDMQDLLQVVSMARACRNNANIKNRQALSRLILQAPRPLAEGLEEELLDELNVRKLEYTEDSSSLLSYQLKPQLRLLGKKLGSKLARVTQALKELDGSKAFAQLKREKQLPLTLDGETLVLTEEEILVEVKEAEGFAAQKEGDFTVALDLYLSQDLIEAGYLREIISKLQTMRKEFNLEVSDRVNVYYEVEEDLLPVLEKYQNELKEEVLVTLLEPLENFVKACEEETHTLAQQNNFYEKTWGINGKQAKFILVKEERKA